MGNVAATIAQNQSTSETPRQGNCSTSFEPIVRTVGSKIITVHVDDQIQFEVDITDPQNNLTCGWLLSEVTRKYTIMLEQMQRATMRSHALKTKSQRQEVRMPRQKRRYIVALKTKEIREGIDSWLNQYERNLSVLKDGLILEAHFAKLSDRPTSTTELWTKKTIGIDDFEQMRVVGRGGFSRVILARKKDTGRLYAIKILRKDQLIKQNQAKLILSERNVLEQLDHPFLIKLHWAFQSQNELYFVLDICTGGQLFVHILQQRNFSEKLAKFYMCEILLGFKHLHERDIVYRDIKPENILIDMDGHIRIADFGLAKLIPRGQRSHSFCGSPEYLSPEMLNNDPHDRRLDIYCLGVLLYEMLTGLPPFYDEDHNQMFENIMTAEVKLDQPSLSKEVKNLLACLLEKDPLMRLQSVDSIMSHPWFEDVEWRNVLNKTIKQPLVPDINSCYFEDDNGEEDDANQSILRSTTLHGNLSRSNILRRQSYYINSTVQLQSCVEDRMSFIRSPSALRQFFDSSVILTNLNESILMNQTSFLDKSMLKQKSINKDDLLFQQQSSPERFNMLSAAAMEIPFTQIDDFADFDFCQPPLAEVQILRVLENQIQRKRKDQRDKARRFKDQFLKMKLEQSRKFQEEVSPIRHNRQPNTSNLQIEDRVGQRSRQEQASRQLSQRLDGGVSVTKITPVQFNGQICGSENTKTFDQRLANKTQIDPSTSPFLQANDLEKRHDGPLICVHQASEPPNQVFSDSEAIESSHQPRQSKMLKRDFLMKSSDPISAVAEEFTHREQDIADKISYCEGRYGQQPHAQVHASLSNRGQKQNNHRNSKAHSLDSFRTEPEQLPDPPSVEDQSGLKESYLIQMQEKHEIRVNHSNHSFSSSLGSSINSQNEDLKLINGIGDQSENQSMTQKPLLSQNTVSIKKLRQSTRNKSNDYSSSIKKFDEGKHNRNKRNGNNLFIQSNHQTMKEPRIQADDQLIFAEHEPNSPHLLPSNHAKLIPKVLLSNEISHEHLKMRNNFSDLKQENSCPYDSLKFNKSIGTSDKKEIYAKTENTSKSKYEKHQSQLDYRQASEGMIKVSQMTTQNKLAPQQFHTATTAEKDNISSNLEAIKFPAHSDSHDATESLREQRNHLPIPLINQDSETDMTVVNFAMMASSRTLLSKDSKQSNQTQTAHEYHINSAPQNAIQPQQMILQEKSVTLQKKKHELGLTPLTLNEPLSQRAQMQSKSGFVSPMNKKEQSRLSSKRVSQKVTSSQQSLAQSKSSMQVRISNDTSKKGLNKNNSLNKKDSIKSPKILKNAVSPGHKSKPQNLNASSANKPSSKIQARTLQSDGKKSPKYPNLKSVTPASLLSAFNSVNGLNKFIQKQGLDSKKEVSHQHEQNECASPVSHDESLDEVADETEESRPSLISQSQNQLAQKDSSLDEHLSLKQLLEMKNDNMLRRQTSPNPAVKQSLVNLDQRRSPKNSNQTSQPLKYKQIMQSDFHVKVSSSQVYKAEFSTSGISPRRATVQTKLTNLNRDAFAFDTGAVFNYSQKSDQNQNQSIQSNKEQRLQMTNLIKSSKTIGNAKTFGLQRQSLKVPLTQSDRSITQSMTQSAQKSNNSISGSKINRKKSTATITIDLGRPQIVKSSETGSKPRFVKSVDKTRSRPQQQPMSQTNSQSSKNLKYQQPKVGQVHQNPEISSPRLRKVPIVRSESSRNIQEGKQVAIMRSQEQSGSPKLIQEESRARFDLKPQSEFNPMMSLGSQANNGHNDFESTANLKIQLIQMKPFMSSQRESRDQIKKVQTLSQSSKQVLLGNLSSKGDINQSPNRGSEYLSLTKSNKEVQSSVVVQKANYFELNQHRGNISPKKAKAYASAQSKTDTASPIKVGRSPRIAGIMPSQNNFKEAAASISAITVNGNPLQSCLSMIEGHQGPQDSSPKLVKQTIRGSISNRASKNNNNNGQQHHQK